MATSRHPSLKVILRLKGLIASTRAGKRTSPLLRATAYGIGVRLPTLLIAGGSITVCFALVRLQSGQVRPVTSATTCLLLVGWTALTATLTRRSAFRAGEPALVTSGDLLMAPAMLAAAGPGRSDRPLGPSHQERGSSKVNFWDALSPTEREALSSIATAQTFPRGLTLFREGDLADYVVVIRSGWTGIFVLENGRERIIAERGPGQLVGERAALQPRFRSATVVALDTVSALVLSTADFARFISAHPPVLDILEGQVYSRLTESPREHGQAGRPGAPGSASPGSSTGADAAFGDPVSARLDGQSCTVVMTDIVGFGDPVRNRDDRRLIQRESIAMTKQAFVHAGVPWARCHLEGRGDGQVIVVRPEIQTDKVVVALTLLGGLLKAYNRRATSPVQIRLRTALHVGPVATEGDALTGDALVFAARLLEAPPFKRSMTETGALLGVMASQYVYENFITHLDPDDYSEVRCRVKETRLVGWMHLTGAALPPSGQHG